MSTFVVIMGILLIIICVASIALVLMQDSKSDGLSGVFTGSASESFYSKNKKRGLKAKLAKWTIISGVALLVVTLIINGVEYTLS